jgi:hypothetical protein
MSRRERKVGERIYQEGPNEERWIWQRRFEAEILAAENGVARSVDKACWSQLQEREEYEPESVKVHRSEARRMRVEALARKFRPGGYTERQLKLSEVLEVVIRGGKRRRDIHLLLDRFLKSSRDFVGMDNLGECIRVLLYIGCIERVEGLVDVYEATAEGLVVNELGLVE